MRIVRIVAGVLLLLLGVALYLSHYRMAAINYFLPIQTWLILGVMSSVPFSIGLYLLVAKVRKLSAIWISCLTVTFYLLGSVAPYGIQQLVNSFEQSEEPSGLNQELDVGW